MPVAKPLLRRISPYFSQIPATLVTVSAAFSAFACGDGVGQPIREAVVSPPDGGMNSGDVPNTPYCQDVANWPASDAADEQSLLPFLDPRLTGPSCTSGNFGGFGGSSSLPTQAAPLTPSPELRCAARRHARYMAESGDFNQVTIEGETPAARARLAGYPSNVVTELIARDRVLALQVLAEEMPRDVCEALLDPRIVAVGVGNFGNFWTIDLAGARAP